MKWKLVDRGEGGTAAEFVELATPYLVDGRKEEGFDVVMLHVIWHAFRTADRATKDAG